MILMYKNVRFFIQQRKKMIVFYMNIKYLNDDGFSIQDKLF